MILPSRMVYLISLNITFIMVQPLESKGFFMLNTDCSDERGIYNVNTKRLKSNEPSETRLWHCRLAHISEKRLSTLHKCGLLSPSEFGTLDRCGSCLMGNLTRSP